MDKPACRLCRYSVPFGTGKIECRRRAPIGATQWAVLNETEWCGEFASDRAPLGEMEQR